MGTRAQQLLPSAVSPATLLAACLPVCLFSFRGAWPTAHTLPPICALADWRDLPRHFEECVEPCMDAAFCVPGDLGAHVRQACAVKWPLCCLAHGHLHMNPELATLPVSRGMCLVSISDPAADSPLNCDAGNLLRSGDVRGYNSMARMFTVEHAMHHQQQRCL